MKVEITSVNLRWESGIPTIAQVYFNGRDEARTITASGHVPIDWADYLPLAADPEALSLYIKKKVASMIYTEDGTE